MSVIKEFDLFIDGLLNRAVEEFKSSSEYDLLKEKLNVMGREWDTMLSKAEKDFAIECFALIRQVPGKEEQYVYSKGLKDCAYN